MHKFIKIPVAKLALFSEQYAELVGEGIQTSPPINVEEDCYLVGSSRLTQEQANELVELYPDVEITNEWPSDWVTKEA